MQGELVVEAGTEAGRRYTLVPGDRLVLGRGDDVDVPVLDDGASRRHVSVELGAGGLLVTDLGSKNGTLLDGAVLPAQEPRQVDEARIQIGVHVLRVRVLGVAKVRDEYERVAELGRGAAGVVFSARHRATGRPVAIKTLIDKVEPSPVARERFRREGTVRIESPHIVQVYEARIENDQAYLVMELVDGEPLDRLLTRSGGRLAPQVAAHLGHQVALGLAAAHGAGVIHRDIKPQNVMVTRDGVAKITDFGIAKLRAASHSLTASGTGMGTLTYVSPEQAEDAKRCSPASDLYSLGATLYHLLAGRPPFLPGPSLIEQLFEDEPPPLARLAPGCPRELARLIHRLLEKDPDDRPSSARALAESLARLGSG